MRFLVSLSPHADMAVWLRAHGDSDGFRPEVFHRGVQQKEIVLPAAAGENRRAECQVGVAQQGMCWV